MFYELWFITIKGRNRRIDYHNDIVLTKKRFMNFQKESTVCETQNFQWSHNTNIKSYKLFYQEPKE